jgi:hypothetical protein
MKVTNCRTRGNEKSFDPIVNNKSLSAGIEHLLVYEFGYGGQITAIEECKITVRTYVMGCVDDTTFEWKEEENKVMHDVISTYAAVKKATQEKPIQDMIVNQIMHITNGKPLSIKMVADFIAGNMPVKATLLELIGSEKHIDQLKKLKNKDLFPIFDLVYLEKQDINEVIGLAI